jgi:hypothetical protein
VRSRRDDTLWQSLVALRNHSFSSISGTLFRRSNDRYPSLSLSSKLNLAIVVIQFFCKVEKFCDAVVLFYVVISASTVVLFHMQLIKEA